MDLIKNAFYLFMVKMNDKGTRQVNPFENNQLSLFNSVV